MVSRCGEGARGKRDEPPAMYSQIFTGKRKTWRVANANVNKYLHRKLGINCHSLRYAFITYMLKKGVSPSIVAAITRHKNLNMILKYTERKEAEKTLEEL